MRWLVRLTGGDGEQHLADLPETDGKPAPREGRTRCGLSGKLVAERPVGHIQNDELAAAAFGLCPRCLARHG